MSELIKTAEALGHDIYEHSKLNSNDSDALAWALVRLGYRKQTTDHTNGSTTC